MQYFQFQPADYEFLFVFCNEDFIAGFCLRAKNNGSTGFSREFEVAAYKISVKMGFKNIFDGRIPFCGQVNIGLYVPNWVDDRCFAIILNIIRGFA